MALESQELRSPGSRMKITGFELFPVRVPPPHFGGKNWLFIRLDTDQDISGYGELNTIGSPFRLLLLAQMVEDIIDQFVIGHDPYNLERLWDTLYGHAGYSHYPEQTRLSVISALDMACWDILGKTAGRPIVDLIGGRFRDKVRTYTYMNPGDPLGDVSQAKVAFAKDPAAMAKRAVEYIELGFTALKFDPFSSRVSFEQTQGQTIPLQYSLSALDAAEASMSAVRDAVGSRVDIILGTHGQMTAAGAIRLARRLERFDPLWFEEPVPPERPDEMAIVARGTSIPIATGERLTTKYDFARLVDAHAAAVFNFDVGSVGGILEAKKIAGIAEASYVQIAPHVAAGPLIAAASIQIALSCPNLLIMEGVETFGGLQADIVDPPIEWANGYVLPNDRPGLGHDLNEDLARSLAPRTGDRGPALLHGYERGRV